MIVWAHRNKGFTIVELLIVVVVIAILAAITIVAYNGIQNRAKTSATASMVASIGKKVLLYAPQNSDLFPDASTYRTDLSIPADTAAATYDYFVSDDRKAFCISVTNTTVATPVSYAVSSTSNGTVSGRCVKNVAPNPKVATTTGWTTSSAGSTGSNTRIATGGPVSNAPSYFTRATTAAADSSPINILNPGTGTSGIPVDSSTTYTLSVYVRSSCVLGSGIRPDFVPYDSSGTAQSTLNGGINTNVADTWLRVSKVNNLGATVAYGRVQIAFSGPTVCPAVSTFDATGIMLTKGDTLYSYGDGDSTGWAWTGTANNSPSFGPAVAS